MKKILFVNFTEIYGGGEVFLKNIIKHKVQEKMSIEKFLLTPKSDKLENGLDGINIIYGFSRKGKFISKLNFEAIYNEVKLINRIIRENEIDCVFLNGIDSYYLSKFINKKVKKIGVWHGINMENSFLKKLLNKTSFNNLDNIVVVSNYQRDIINKKFLNKYKDKIEVVHIGRDENLFKKEILNSKNRSETIKLLIVARLEKLKGHIDLIEAMKIVCQKHNDVKLIIAGEGEEEGLIRERIKEQKLEKYIEMVGFVNPIEYYTKSDIFILPSHSEAFPLVNLEAMASGLPIIATNVGGIPEAIEDGENGFLIEPGDIKKLAEVMCILIESNETREKFAIKSRKKFNENFTQNKMCEKIYRIILR